MLPRIGTVDGLATRPRLRASASSVVRNTRPAIHPTTLGPRLQPGFRDHVTTIAPTVRRRHKPRLFDLAGSFAEIDLTLAQLARVICVTAGAGDQDLLKSRNEPQADRQAGRPDVIVTTPEIINVEVPQDGWGQMAALSPR